MHYPLNNGAVSGIDKKITLEVGYTMGVMAK